MCKHLMFKCPILRFLSLLEDQQAFLPQIWRRLFWVAFLILALDQVLVASV